MERSKICETMKELEIPNQLVQVVRSVYRNVRGRVQINGKKVRYFRMAIRIEQGDSLSPLLFIMIMDRIIKNSKQNR